MRRTFGRVSAALAALMLGVTVSANAATLTGSFNLGSNLDVTVTQNSILWGGANNVNFNSANGDFAFLTGTDATLADLMFPPDLVGVPISHTDFLALPEPTAFSIVRIEVDFKRAARVDDALLVRTTYDSVTGARLNVTQRIFRGEELIAQAVVQAPAALRLTSRRTRSPGSGAPASTATRSSPR